MGRGKGLARRGVEGAHEINYSYIPHSSMSYSSGKEYMCSGMPSGKTVSFWALILWVFHIVSLNISNCFCSSGMKINASSILGLKDH